MYYLHLTPDQAEQIGEVSHSTLRTRDLLENISVALSAVVKTLTTPETENFTQLVIARLELDDINEFLNRTDKTEGYFESSDDDRIQADSYIEMLFNTLNEFAPEGWCFGAHEGDGACFGYWKSNDDNEEGL